MDGSRRSAVVPEGFSVASSASGIFACRRKYAGWRATCGRPGCPTLPWLDQQARVAGNPWLPCRGISWRLACRSLAERPERSIGLYSAFGFMLDIRRHIRCGNAGNRGSGLAHGAVSREPGPVAGEGLHGRFAALHYVKAGRLSNAFREGLHCSGPLASRPRIVTGKPSDQGAGEIDRKPFVAQTAFPLACDVVGARLLMCIRALRISSARTIHHSVHLACPPVGPFHAGSQIGGRGAGVRSQTA